MDLTALEPWDADGNLRVVVETPRGASVKIAYDDALGVMKLGRPLALGVTYPYDFGFVPGTRAPDGDPLDVLLLLDVATFPGVLVECRPIGVVRATQSGQPGKGAKARRVRNDRVVAVACEDRRRGHVKDARDLPAREREEIELFFRSAVALEGKELELEGWGSADDARATVTRYSRPDARSRAEAPPADARGVRSPARGGARVHARSRRAARR